MTPSSPQLFALAIQIVIILAVIRRSYSMMQGVAYSLPRLALLPVLILVLWGISELESIVLTPWAIPYLIALDLAILIGTAIVSTPIAERMTTVHRDPAGGGSYRIGISMAVLFVGVFVARIALAAVLFPSAFQFGSPPAGFPPIQQQIVLGVIDALFSMSAGLLVGRSVGIYRRWESARPTSPTPATR